MASRDPRWPPRSAGSRASRVRNSIPARRALVTTFAADDRLLLAGIGPAGSGKTTAMRAYAHVLRQSGRHLVPLSTSAAAADVLGKELSASAENLHKFLYEWAKGQFAGKLRAGQSVPTPARPFRLRPGDVVLVDEAGMAGTFLLDKLVSIATAQGATVRLLGDDRQLSAVETGGAFRLVANQPGAPELTVLHRFKDRKEGEQTLKIRSGDGSAVDWYHARGRIRSGSREAMAQAAYAAWQADMLAGKTTLMAAAGGADVVELSAQARADRVRAGQVESDGVVLSDGNLAGEGDWIVTRHNDRRLCLFAGRDWVKNGDSWHVEKRHVDGSLTVRGMEHGGKVTLPAEYVGTYVELMYATTAHRAQGDTVDTAHPLITAGMTREALYVLASRAREQTTFYVATHDLPFDEDARVDQVRIDPRAYAARKVMLNVIATEGTALSATETITRKQEEAGSLSTLVPRYLHAAHQDAESRYVEAANEVFVSSGGDSLVADPAWGAVVRRLYDAEVSGWKPAQLLAVAKDMRELDTAESVAEVMSWRIDAITAGRSARGRAPGLLRGRHPARPLHRRRAHGAPRLPQHPRSSQGDRLHRFIDQAAANDLTRAVISLDILDSQQNAFITRANFHSDTLRSIESAVTTLPTLTKISCVTMRSTLKELPKFVEHARDLNRRGQ